MKKVFLLIVIACHILIYASDSVDFEQRTGLKGTYNETEKVFKASFPRNDIKVSVNGTPLDPFMGLTSWAAFTPINKDLFLVMGDLVLFEDEVNPIMSALFENNIDVTALHNHFFFDQPKVYFMHIAGTGSIEALANGVKKAIEIAKQLREKNPNISAKFENPSALTKNSITPKRLNDIFNKQGQEHEGIVKFVFGRKTKMNDTELGKEMGINTWAAFGGSEENAIVDGDFAVEEDELQPVLRILRKGKINIVAIHNHMTMEKPRIIFLHFWGMGHAEDLAKTIKEALQATKVKSN